MADDEYSKKVENLQQYVPFLEKMIAQLKDPSKPNRELQLSKITSLHSLITEKKKLKLETLTRCEQVILQLYNKAKAKSASESAVKPPQSPKKITIKEEKDSEVIRFKLKDTGTKGFFLKPSVFDRLGNRVFYKPDEEESFQESLNNLRERLQEQDIRSLENNSNVADEENDRLRAEKEDSFQKEKSEHRATSEKTEDKLECVDGKICHKSSEKTEHDKEKSSQHNDKYKERSRHGELSEERDVDDKRKEKFKKDSKDSRNHDKYRERYKSRDSSEETKNLRKSRSDKYKERRRFRSQSREKDSKKRQDERKERRKLRDTSEETEDSTERRKFRDSSEEVKSDDKTKSDEKDSKIDKYAERRKMKEQRSLYSRYTYKSTRRKNDRSWTETRHRIRIKTSTTLNSKLNKIKKDYRKLEEKRKKDNLENSKYKWHNLANKDTKVDAKNTSFPKINLEDIPLPPDPVNIGVPDTSVGVRNEQPLATPSSLLIKSEVLNQTDDFQHVPSTVSISTANTSPRSSNENYWNGQFENYNYQSSSSAVPNSEIQQLDYYPVGSTPFHESVNHELPPPILSPQHQELNREDIRVANEVSEQECQDSNTSKKEEPTPPPQVQELSEEAKQMEIINRFLKKLLENEHTKSAASAFIENVSKSLDDEKLKAVVETVVPPKEAKPKEVKKGRVVNRKLILDDDDEAVGSSQGRNRKASKQIIDDSDSEEEVTSTVQDKSSNSKKKKSELDILHEDIRNMFVNAGPLTSAGKRMRNFLKDDSDDDIMSPQLERTTRSLAKRRMEDVRPVRRSRNKPRQCYAEYSDEERLSPKRLQIPCNEETIEKKESSPSKSRNKKDSLKSPKSELKQLLLADEEENKKKKVVKAKQSPHLRLSHMDETDDDKKKDDDKRKSAKLLKCYVEVESDVQKLAIDHLNVQSREKTNQSPKKVKSDNKKPIVSSTPETPKKRKKVRRVFTPQKAKRKRVSSWALGIVPKTKKKKKEHIEEQKKQKETKSKPHVAAEEVGAGELPLELVEPDKDYCALPPKKRVNCKLCDFRGNSIALHYRQSHPDYDVLSSRLSSAQAEEAIKQSKEMDLEGSEERTLLLSHKYPFKCRFCDSRMDTQLCFFYDHVSGHTGEFRHICSECPYACSSRKGVALHYKKVHNKPKDNKPTVSVTSEVFGYLCVECNYVQIRRKSVEDHINIYHLGEGKKIVKINLSSIVIKQPPKKKPGPKSVTRLITPSETVKKKPGPKSVTRLITPSETVKAVAKRRPSPAKQKKPVEKKVEAEPPAKRKKTENESEGESLLSLLENFERNNKEVEIDFQKDKTHAQTTQQIKQELLEEFDEQRQSEKTSPKAKKNTSAVKTDFGKNLKKKFESLKLFDEVTIQILKKGTIRTSEATSSELDKTEPVSEGEDVEDNEPNLQEEEEEIDVVTVEENVTTIEELSESSSENKTKDIDMAVFTCKTDLEEENEKIDRERLQKMMQLNETIKKKRLSFSIVDRLSDRLMQDPTGSDSEEEISELQPRTHTLLHQKKTLLSKSSKVFKQDKDTIIVMSAELFDVFKKHDVLIYVCRIGSCHFFSEDCDAFKLHLNKAHTEVNEEYKMTDCTACQKKIEASVHDSFLKTFFSHMVERHLVVKPETVLNAGFLDVVKDTNNVKYVCRVVPCTFSTEDRALFVLHWNTRHCRFKITHCRICGTIIKPLEGETLLTSFFAHLDEVHLKSEETPFPFTISEVVSVNDDPTTSSPSTSREQNFVIQSVVSLAEEPTSPSRDTPFVIENVVSLADDSDPAGTSEKVGVEKVAEEASASPYTNSGGKSAAALKWFLTQPDDVYKCPDYHCYFTSAFKQRFERHCQTHVPQDALVRCVYCDVKTPMGLASSHIDTHHLNCFYSCSQCLYRAHRKEYVIMHAKLKHKTNAEVHPLPRGPKGAKARPKCLVLHEVCLPYRCGVAGCGLEFLFQSDFSDHLASRHDFMVCGHTDKQSKCAYVCSNANSMVEHWRSHGCYTYHCLLCKAGSMELVKMLEHYALTHPNQGPSIADRRRSRGGKVCGFNGEAFAQMKFVSNEIFSGIGNRLMGTTSSEVIEIEDDEDDGQVSALKLSEEMLLKKFGQLCEPVERELKCPLCVDFKTKKIPYFIYHLLLELKCYRFKCNNCDYVCITHGAMTVHCLEEHQLNTLSQVTASPIEDLVQYWIELVINYQCKVLIAKFNYERGCDYQSLYKNTQCDICRKWVTNIHDHEMSHWAEMVYICSLCRCRRATLNEMVGHIDVSHPGRVCSFARAPSVLKVTSTWKSLTSAPSKQDIVTEFLPVQSNSGESQPVLLIPSAGDGQRDEVLFACMHCPFTVKSVEMLQKHNFEVHGGKTDNLKCKVLTKSKVEVMLLMHVLP